MKFAAFLSLNIQPVQSLGNKDILVLEIPFAITSFLFHACVICEQDVHK